MADISRDPRWGRIVEGSGEDPYLGRVFAAARVEGFRAGGLATGAKHFAGYGAVVGGRDYDATEMPTTTLRDVVLPPFRAAVEAGSLSLMSAFNALNGVPATANPWLLTDVLRGEWGFDGFVISDWAAIEELLGHGLAADGAEAARKAFLAGVDMDLMGRLYERHLADEVKAGRVPLARSTTPSGACCASSSASACSTARMPTPRAATPFSRPRNRARWRATVARETLVLLQNRDGALPLSAPTRSVAVVGGLADGAVRPARAACGARPRRGHGAAPRRAAAARGGGGRRPVLRRRLRSALRRRCRLRRGDRDGALRRRRGRRARRAARHERRSRLARLSRPARPAAAALRSARRHGQAGGRRAPRRPAARARADRRGAVGRPDGLVSRYGGRRGDHGNAVRRHQSERQAAADMAAHDRADPDLLQPSAERAADRSRVNRFTLQLPRRDARRRYSRSASA